MNQEILSQTGAETVIANAPVKELVAIEIGGKDAVIEGVGMQTISGRYRPPAARGDRLATLSGRTSKPGMYQILPWSLDVVVEAKYAGELLRRIRGTESFLSVEAYRLEPITRTSFDRARNELLAYAREDYGTEGVVRLRVVGESLAFELAGGRITTLAQKAPEASTEESQESGT
jgi:hypothetical protein